MKGKGVKKASAKKPVTFVQHCSDCREDILERLRGVPLARADGGKRPMTPAEQKKFAAKFPTRRDVEKGIRSMLQKHRELVEGSGPKNENRALWSFLRALAFAAGEGDLGCNEALRMMAHWALELRLGLAVWSDRDVKLRNHVQTLREAVSALNQVARRDIKRFTRVGPAFTSWPVNLADKNEALAQARELIRVLGVGGWDPFSKVTASGPLSRLVVDWLQEVDPFIAEKGKSLGVGGNVLEDWGSWPPYRRENTKFYAARFAAELESRRKGIPMGQWEEFKHTSNRRRGDCLKAIEDSFMTIFGQIEKAGAQRESGNE